jgi:hypothetical protein
MATKILLKKSVTGGASPLTSDLDQGELAINLVDRKIYTKDAGNSITEISGAYVDGSAPSNPVEGDLWYDTANNLLKAHNGTGFVSAGYQNLAELEDVTITSIASGEILKWDGSAFINNTLAEAGIAAASHTHTASEITDFTTAAQATITAGTGVAVAAGVVSIGQDVETTSDVTFAKVVTSTIEGGSTITIDTAGVGDNTGTVVIAGDLTVNGTTTTVNSNEVNIGDAIILLNSDETSAASANAGLEIERGTDANVSFIWNEADDKWDLNNEELQNVSLDGGSY